MEAKYLSQLPSRASKITSKQETSMLWLTILKQYLPWEKNYIHEPLTTLSGHPYLDWKITYYHPDLLLLWDPQHPGRMILLGQFNDLPEQGVHGMDWDVEKGDIYARLCSTDQDHPLTKSLGLLAAGPYFVLYEVVGRQQAKYLIGNKTKPAVATDTQTSLQVQTKLREYFAMSKETCKLDVYTQTPKAGPTTSAK